MNATERDATFPPPAGRLLPYDAPDAKDRAACAIIGLAAGDAVGATNEFRTRLACEENPVTDMVGGGCWKLTPGEWTDDTSMAFAMGDAIRRAGAFSPRSIMSAFAVWRAGVAYGPSSGRGCFDIGATTARALAVYETQPRNRPRNPFCGPTEPHTAGNGSIMRLAPVAVYTLRLPRELRVRVAGDSSRLTHGAARCAESCQFLSELLRALILRPATTLPARDVLADAFSAARESAGISQSGALAAELDAGRWRSATAHVIKSTGYVLDTLTAAMWAVYGAASYEEAVLRAANLGGDTDTVAAVAGQIAGALYGVEGVPDAWAATLDRGAELAALARDLHDMSAAPAVDVWELWAG